MVKVLISWFKMCKTETRAVKVKERRCAEIQHFCSRRSFYSEMIINESPPSCCPPADVLTCMSSLLTQPNVTYCDLITLFKCDVSILPLSRLFPCFSATFSTCFPAQYVAELSDSKSGQLQLMETPNKTCWKPDRQVKVNMSCVMWFLNKTEVHEGSVIVCDVLVPLF